MENIEAMSRGPSGRLVVELEPELKQQLYSTLALDGLTFKDWLTDQVTRYIDNRHQPQLFAAESPVPSYTRPKRKTGA